MGFRQRTKKKRANLQSRHKEQTVNKDNKGRFPSVIMKDKLPAGVETWHCKEGEHTADIIPWEAGSDMPLSERGTPIAEEGDLDYVLDIAMHTNVGSMKVPYVCPYENFGEPCPICEYIKSHELDKEVWKVLKAKRRVFYLVWVHDTRETERKGVMLWEISHYAMEEKLAEIAKIPKGGGAVAFSDHESGKIVAWTRKGSGMTNTQYLGHKFIDRDMPIPDKILDQTFPVDQVIDMRPAYEDIEKAFKGQLAKLDAGVSPTDDAGSNFDKDEKPPMWQDDYDEEEPEKKKTLKKTLKKKSRFKK
jgi:hypothetical protein